MACAAPLSSRSVPCCLTGRWSGTLPGMAPGPRSAHGLCCASRPRHHAGPGPSAQTLGVIIRTALLHRRATELTLLALFFGGLAAVILETAWLENTFDLHVPLGAAALSTPVVVYLAYRFHWLRHASPIERWPAWAMLFVSVACFVVAGASYFNRLGSKLQGAPGWVVTSKAHLPPRPKSPEQWRLLLASSGESHWVSVTPGEWGAAQVGQPFLHAIFLGQLGMRFVPPPGKQVAAAQ